ncbi:hypothetical protein AZI86_02125 [Bdellovibrio bacteriovorus]|uniref:Uncharacterized protein n=1 Tax=Bdellovibrio bacteriovorus TaxID=959 RepID=A0A150WN26_BDEBC|nr:hypothetical protein [Bdellovibrio bacteriovorus]KYG65893.1 hypothetical protein AZI86_02125 [Bdellovibrio bacteriovorus]
MINASELAIALTDARVLREYGNVIGNLVSDLEALANYGPDAKRARDFILSSFGYEDFSMDFDTHADIIRSDLRGRKKSSSRLAYCEAKEILRLARIVSQLDKAVFSQDLSDAELKSFILESTFWRKIESYVQQILILMRENQSRREEMIFYAAMEEKNQDWELYKILQKSRFKREYINVSSALLDYLEAFSREGPSGSLKHERVLAFAYYDEATLKFLEICGYYKKSLGRLSLNQWKALVRLKLMIKNFDNPYENVMMQALGPLAFRSFLSMHPKWLKIENQARKVLALLRKN